MCVCVSVLWIDGQIFARLLFKKTFAYYTVHQPNLKNINLKNNTQGTCKQFPDMNSLPLSIFLFEWLCSLRRLNSTGVWGSSARWRLANGLGSLPLALYFLPAFAVFALFLHASIGIPVCTLVRSSVSSRAKSAMAQTPSYKLTACKKL